MDLDYINDVEEDLHVGKEDFEPAKSDDYQPIFSAYEEEIREIYELAKMVHEVDPTRDIDDLIKEFIAEVKQKYGVSTEDDTYEVIARFKR